MSESSYIIYTLFCWRYIYSYLLSLSFFVHFPKFVLFFFIVVITYIVFCVLFVSFLLKRVRSSSVAKDLEPIMTQRQEWGDFRFFFSCIYVYTRSRCIGYTLSLKCHFHGDRKRTYCESTNIPSAAALLLPYIYIYINKYTLLVFCCHFATAQYARPADRVIQRFALFIRGKRQWIKHCNSKT